MTDINDTRDLILELTLNAPRALVWRCWTEADLVEKWFTPKPYTTQVESMDLRPGGASVFIMRGPNGEEIRNPGVYLDVVPEQRLVFTDAYTEAWKPSEKPFFTGEILLKDAGDGKTHYTAIAHHWTAEDCAAHAEMGFHEGWKQAALQLEELAATLGG